MAARERSSTLPPDPIRDLIQRILDVHKRLQGAKAPHDRTVIEQQIAATDEEIDHLVYELYGLTEEGIAVVEGAGVDSSAVAFGMTSES